MLLALGRVDQARLACWGLAFVQGDVNRDRVGNIIGIASGAISKLVRLAGGKIWPMDTRTPSWRGWRSCSVLVCSRMNTKPTRLRRQPAKTSAPAVQQRTSVRWWASTSGLQPSPRSWRSSHRRVRKPRRNTPPRWQRWTRQACGLAWRWQCAPPALSSFPAQRVSANAGCAVQAKGREQQLQEEAHRLDEAEGDESNKV